MIKFELIGAVEYRVFRGAYPGETLGKVEQVSEYEWRFIGGGVETYGISRIIAVLKGLYSDEYIPPHSSARGLFA